MVVSIYPLNRMNRKTGAHEPTEGNFLKKGSETKNIHRRVREGQLGDWRGK